MTRARDAALAVLTRVEQGGAYAAAALESELRAVDDPREASFATELVLGVLRNQRFLDGLLERASERGLKKIDPTIRRILRLAVYQMAFLEVPSRAAVSQAVEQVGRSKARGLGGLVNALLRRISVMDPETLRPDIEDNGGPVGDLSVHLGMPQWLIERLIDTYGRDRAFAVARAFNRPSRRTLRVNPRRASREDVLKMLEGDSDGGFVLKGALTPWSIDVQNRSVVSRLVESGAAVFQDEGAQLVALAVEPKAGDRILDACAGRGGKTAALAAMVGKDAQILAVDRSESKLQRLVFELGRQGLEAGTLAADLTEDQETIDAKYSKVLLDAPCSGTGTLGRRPEIRWRIAPESVASLVEVQDRLLKAAAKFVAPGGRLVYAVCSVLKEEGMGHGASFLERHPDFHPAAKPPSLWPERISWSGGMVFVDPSETQTDGYQILAFEKK